MSLSAFKPDQKLTDVLSKNRFTLSAEVMPPRNGSEQRQVLAQIQTLIEAGAQFLAVTKGAGGSLRGGSLPIAQAVKESFGVPCIAHFTCRDLNAHEVENQLMDHHYFGIRNILALRGDPPDGQPDWKPREGGHSFAYQLIGQIRALNEGRYLPRPGGPALTDGQAERTDFCIGAAAYPEFPDPANRIEYFKLKVEAGAQYGITDMLFDPEIYARFVDDCAAQGIHVPFLPGTRLLKSRTQAAKMCAKFKVAVPKTTLDALPENVTAPAGSPEAMDAIKRGVDLFMKQVDRLKALGAPGIHLYVLMDTAGATAALGRLVSERSEGTNAPIPSIIRSETSAGAPLAPRRT